MNVIVAAFALFLAISSAYSLRKTPTIFYRHDYKFCNQYQAFYKYESSPTTWLDAINTCSTEKAELFFPEDIDELEDIKKNIDNLDQKTMHVAMTKSKEMGGFYTIGLLLSFPSHLSTMMKSNYLDIPTYCGNMEEAGITKLDRSLKQILGGKSLEDGFNNRLEADFKEPKGDCVYIINMTTLSTAGCEVKLPFICKKKFNGIKLPCNTVDEEYKYSQEFSKCFKVHITPATWAKAFQICRNEDGRLAIPVKSRNDNYFSITTQERGYDQSGRVWKPLHYPQSYHIGIRQIFNEFFDLAGNLVPELPLLSSPSDNGEGNASSEAEILTEKIRLCGTQISDQTLKAEPCDDERPFLCEKFA